MSSAVIVIRGLNVTIEDRQLLCDIDLQCAERSFHVVMGPVGVGKSTLMSVLGACEDEVVHKSSGSVLYRGKSAGPQNRPGMVPQATREEQKNNPRTAEAVMRLIDEALRDDPAALCLDEPTASLAHEEVLPILWRLQEEAKRRAILMVTHNTEHARLVGEHLTVIGGGRVLDSGPVDRVFNAPTNPATRQFLKTGNMTIPRPDAPARTLAPEFRGVPQLGRELMAAASDENLIWIIRGSFAVVTRAARDEQSTEALLDYLKRQSQRVAVVGDPADLCFRDALKNAGLEQIDPPPPPTADRAAAVRARLSYVEMIEERIARGYTVFVIPGRSKGSEYGLAALQLVYRGLTAMDTIEIINRKAGDDHVSLEEQQILWDLELALDLAPALADSQSNDNPDLAQTR